jgi:2-polyprenyl-6-methoxyphenol hydroxylase-like FAD-dependent oxidoreductase
MRENGTGFAGLSGGNGRALGELDALILGGGPAGSTAAAVLAEKGRRVLVVERERFPRYKVGESLLPYCYFPLERIGMIGKLRASGFVKKYSVQFASVNGRISSPFYFFQHLDHEAAQTWQVVRSEFDRMMLDNAVEKGARVSMGATAKRLILDGGRCEGLVVEKDGERFPIRAPVTIDCGGRHGFAATQMGWIRPDPHLNKVAIWTYYRGAKRDRGYDEGATTVAYLPGKGWFWYIPLPDDVVSVGVVAERDYLHREGKELEAIWNREIRANPWVAEHLAPGRRCEPLRVTAPKKEVREKLFPGELAESYEAALSRITPAQAHLGLGSVVAILQPLLGALPASTKNSLEEALDDPRYFSAASSTGMNVLLNMVLYPALCLAAYTTMGGELFSQQANASIFIGLLIASGETVVRLREALFQGAPSDEARFRGAPYGLALAPLAAPFLGTRSKRSQERGSIPIEGYYSGEFDEKTERSRRYGEAYSVEEENNAYLLRLEFPRRVPVSALKREMGIGDEMPDYEYELSLQEDQFLVKGNMTDPDIRKLAAVSPAFPPDFTKRIAFDRPIASFRHRYRDKTLEVILFQR